MRYRQLDEGQIRETITTLASRIRERFPDSGLANIADELKAIARETTVSIEYLERPNWSIRIAVSALIVTLVAVVIAGIVSFHIPGQTEGWTQLVQGIESAINDVVFLAAAIFFLVTIETRLKRRRALRALHELRSVVHIVDMHQLTKDPERLISSLTSKLAALFMQHLHDPVVLAAVNEIEVLAAGLSNKIWQKITLLR